MSDCKDYISGRKANVRMKLRERRARTTSAVARRRNSELDYEDLNLSSKLLYLTLKETQSCLKVLLQIAEKKVGKNPRKLSDSSSDECDGAIATADHNTVDDHMIIEVEERIKSLLSLHKQIATEKESKLPKNYVKNNEETDSESEIKITKPTKVDPKLTRQYSFNSRTNKDKPLPNLPKRQLLAENRGEDADLDNLPNWMILDLLEGNDPFKPLDLDVNPATPKTPTTRNMPKEPHVSMASKDLYGSNVTHRGYDDQYKDLACKADRYKDLACKDDRYKDLPDCVHHVSYNTEDGMDSRRYPDLIKPCKQKFRLDRGWLEKSEQRIEASPPQRKLSGRRFSYPHFDQDLDSDIDNDVECLDDSGIGMLYEALEDLGKHDRVDSGSVADRFLDRRDQSEGRHNRSTSTYDETDSYPANLDTTWRSCGQNLSRLATTNHRKASRNGRRHSLGGGDPAETRIIRSMVAENPRKFVVSDLLTLVTLAGAYYCINKIKSILV